MNSSKKTINSFNDYNYTLILIFEFGPCSLENLFDFQIKFSPEEIINFLT